MERVELAGQGAAPVRPGAFVLRDGRIVFRHVGSNGSDRATDAALSATVQALRQMPEVRDVSSVMRVEGAESE